MGPVGKIPILGIMERGGRLRGWVMKDVRKNMILPRVYDTVKHGSKLNTDAAGYYVGLRSDYVH